MRKKGKKRQVSEKRKANRGGEALNPPVTCRDVNQSDFSTAADKPIYSGNSCSYQPLTHCKSTM